MNGDIHEEGKSYTEQQQLGRGRKNVTNKKEEYLSHLLSHGILLFLTQPSKLQNSKREIRETVERTQPKPLVFPQVILQTEFSLISSSTVWSLRSIIINLEHQGTVEASP